MKRLSVQDVVDHVVDRLASGIYPPGGRLPTSRSLAAELGVHRNTIAKAYQSLVDLGGYFYADGATGMDLQNRGEPRRLTAVFVSPGFFSALGVAPAQGRLPRKTSSCAEGRTGSWFSRTHSGCASSAERRRRYARP